MADRWPPRGRRSWAARSSWDRVTCLAEGRQATCCLPFPRNRPRESPSENVVYTAEELNYRVQKLTVQGGSTNVSSRYTCGGLRSSIPRQASENDRQSHAGEAAGVNNNSRG